MAWKGITGQVVSVLPSEWSRTIAKVSTGYSGAWKLQEAATKNENTFEQLLEATKYCSLGQLTDAMFGVGGQYRSNM